MSPAEGLIRMSACSPCFVLPPIDVRRWPSVREAFCESAAMPLVQAWRDVPEEAFCPGSVRMGMHADALWTLADLDDDDIVVPPADFNDAVFMKGDVFEMFFQPEGQRSYFEFHVTPGNVHLQLRFPDHGAAREIRCGSADPLLPFKIDEARFESWTEVREGRWSVLSRIPWASIVEEPSASAAGRIRFSFCRYDWTRGRSRPVLSSTSPHRALDFHRIGEWRTLARAPAASEFPGT